MCDPNGAPRGPWNRYGARLGFHPTILNLEVRAFTKEKNGKHSSDSSKDNVARCPTELEAQGAQKGNRERRGG